MPKEVCGGTNGKPARGLARLWRIEAADGSRGVGNPYRRVPWVSGILSAVRRRSLATDHRYLSRRDPVPGGPLGSVRALAVARLAPVRPDLGIPVSGLGSFDDRQSHFGDTLS